MQLRLEELPPNATATTTARRNLALARDKLAHLRAAPEATWLRFRPAVDETFARVEKSVVAAETAAN